MAKKNHLATFVLLPKGILECFLLLLVSLLHSCRVGQIIYSIFCMSGLNPLVVSRQNVRKAFILILYLVGLPFSRVLLYPFLILAFSLNFFFFQVVFGQTNTFSRFLRKAWRNWRKAWIEVWSSSRKSTLALAVVEFSMKFKLSNGGVYISLLLRSKFFQKQSCSRCVLQLREKQRHWFISLLLCSLFYLLKVSYSWPK